MRRTTGHRKEAMGEGARARCRPLRSAARDQRRRFGNGCGGLEGGVQRAFRGCELYVYSTRGLAFHCILSSRHLETRTGLRLTGRSGSEVGIQVSTCHVPVCRHP